MQTTTTSIAVIGGSGFYSLFEDGVQREIATPYGTVTLTFGTVGDKCVVFLPRHGATHSEAPHLINYRANIWALASVGVNAIVSTAAVGAVHPDFAVDSLVILDQYIDRTNARADTFFDEGSVQHLGSAEPFCPILRATAVDRIPEARSTGTVVVVQGPRFSTRAESEWFRAAGAHLVNMTLYPEVPLASELNMGTVTLAYITDNDAAPTEELTAELVFARLKAAQPRIVAAIAAIVDAIPADYAGRPLIDPAEVAIVLGRPS